jgi:hypothetical protein
METHLLSGGNCSCCKGANVVEGINSIKEVAPNIVKYFKYPEETKKYSKGSNKKVECICPNCGREKEISINKLYSRGFRCNSCGSGKSYPEKFMGDTLEQLNIKFKKEYSPDWANKKRYDFHFEYG